MNFFRKNLFGLAVVSLLALSTVLVAEGFHHHDEALEGHDDCSFCAWQMTGSQAPAIPTIPFLIFSALVFVLYFAFTPFHFSTFVRFSRGRSPPSILL